MKRIGILSDTHAYWDDRYAHYFAACDEIWHAGDIGSYELAERLSQIAPLRAVCGNIDGGTIRLVYPPLLRFRCEDVEVMMTHIGGRPERYEPTIARMLRLSPPNLFVCGHSHILCIARPKGFQHLHINPGAAGISGFQRQRTLVCLQIDGSTISNVEVVELG